MSGQCPEATAELAGGLAGAAARRQGRPTERATARHLDDRCAGLRRWPVGPGDPSRHHGAKGCGACVASEERLALAVAGGREGVWDWNLETNAVVSSHAGRDARLFRRRDRAARQRLGSDWLIPTTSHAPTEPTTAWRSGRTATYEAEFRLRHKDGHYVHVLSRGFPVRRQPGAPVVRVGTPPPPPAHHPRAGAAGRESEERLTLAFAGAQEGVWDWNLETGAVVYSPRWKQMLGYADDEIEPHVSAWERLLHPDDMARAPGGQRERRARRRRPTRASSASATRTATTSTSSRAAFPVRREPGGPVVRIVGTHFDLTARKQAEAERARTELLARLVFAQEDERRRIAREMHDQFGEQLTALSRSIGMLKEACGDRRWRGARRRARGDRAAARSRRRSPRLGAASDRARRSRPARGARQLRAGLVEARRHRRRAAHVRAARRSPAVRKPRRRSIASPRRR